MPSDGRKRERPGKGTVQHKRSEGDVQYDFDLCILGFEVPGGRGSGAGGKPSEWRVTWKRGEKRTGRTPTLAAQDGAVEFNFGFKCDATLMRKSETRLHKKLIDFVVTELRPREDGKHDKRGSEGSLNLGMLVSAAELGAPVREQVHTITCGKDPAKGPVKLAVRVSGRRRPDSLTVPGDDDDALTDMPMDLASMAPSQGGCDVPTHIGSDRDLDDDLGGELGAAFDDDVGSPYAKGRSARQGGGRSPPTLGTLGGGVPVPAAPAGIGTQHEAQVDSLRRQLERLRGEEAERAKELQKERRRAEKAEAELQRVQQDVARRPSVHAVAGAAAVKQQLAEQVLLQTGVLQRAPAEGSAAPPHAILLRALIQWSAFSPANNPSGSPNTFLCNTATCLSAAVESAAGSASASARLAGVAWNLLLGINAQWPQHGVAAALDPAIVRCRASLTTRRTFVRHSPHVLASQLKVPPLLLESTDPGFVAGSGLGAGSRGAAVLPADGRKDAASHKEVILSFSAHVAACLAHALDSIASAVQRWCGGPGGLAAAAAALFTDAAVGATLPTPPYSGVAVAEGPRLLLLAPRVHQALLEADVGPEVCRAVLAEVLHRIDIAMFHHLLQTPKLCSGATAFALGQRVAAVEGWMREALHMAVSEIRREPPMPHCKQAQLLLLVQGADVGDEAMWAPLTVAQRHRLLSQYQSEEPGQGIDPAVLALSERQAGGAQPEMVHERAVVVPKLATASRDVEDDPWDTAIPPALAAAAMSFPQLQLLGAQGEHCATGDDD
eukprot:TRINITY_DN49935_c0_g1_i1.p1 TRINITY_DN49935_c0_g1~~TRINITY_DN49935_c0_g1_i1.p1  ORF type:complete len:780 (+),score=181.73 TRINITY_DN49935_c0_g1_i1:74-2413(+)